LLCACGGGTKNPASATSSDPAPSGIGAKLGTAQFDVTYCSPDGAAQRLDLFYPSQAPGANVPVIVHIHGGQLIKGNKGSNPGTPAGMWKPAVLARGYVFVSINYRLGPTYRFPAMIEDAKCAIRYLRANASTLFIDADRIGVTGTSSGGYLAALVATADPSAGFDGNGGYQGVPSRVRAAVIEYGADMNLAQPVYSAAELEERQGAFPQPTPASLIFSATVVNHVTPDDPPCFLLHGDHDMATNPQDSIDLNAKLQSVGVPSSFRVSCR
jgi:acetyl esterase/lipase